MTLIECFDQVPLENILGSLQLRPDLLIFLGDNDSMRRSARRYREFLARRGMDTQVILYPISSQDPAAVVRDLTELIARQDECVVDVTGGEDHVLLTLGAALACLTPQQRKQVRLQKFDISSGEGKPLTVEELIALHGGKVHPRALQVPSHVTVREIEPLWQLMRQDPKAWNKTLADLAELERYSEDKQEIRLHLPLLSHSIADLERKEATVHRLVEQLDMCGAVTDFSSRDVLRYRYRSSLIRSCLQKAGNLLEIKCLLEAREAKQDGAPFFHDCRMSVTIDWDGVVHTGAHPDPETRNEVDLILTRGPVPLFVSCKNGGIEEAELYKLNAVAARFGSTYAKKMLIASDLDQGNPRSDLAFAQRARDMGIYLVEHAAQLDKKGWREIWKEAMEF